MNGLQTYLQKGTKILFSCATVDWSGHATRYLHLTWSRNTSSENALRYVAKQRLHRRRNNADLINLLAVSPDGHLNNYTNAIFLWDFVSEWGGSRKKTYYLAKDLYRFQTPDTETDWSRPTILISGLIYLTSFIFIRRVFVVDKYDYRVKHISKLTEENRNSHNSSTLFLSLVVFTIYKNWPRPLQEPVEESIPSHIPIVSRLFVDFSLTRTTWTSSSRRKIFNRWIS